MHFKIKRIKLLNALAKATRAVSVRSPLPVLTGIKFDLQAHQLILTGSDSDITIQTIIDEDDDLVILKEGAVVLNSRYIFDIERSIVTILKLKLLMVYLLVLKEVKLNTA